MPEKNELADLTLLKRLLALSKRKIAPHTKFAFTDQTAVRMINVLSMLDLYDKHYWFVEFITQLSEREKAVMIEDELTRLAMSLDEESVSQLINAYKKKIRSLSL